MSEILSTLYGSIIKCVTFYITILWLNVERFKLRSLWSENFSRVVLLLIGLVVLRFLTTGHKSRRISISLLFPPVHISVIYVGFVFLYIWNVPRPPVLCKKRKYVYKKQNLNQINPPHTLTDKLHKKELYHFVRELFSRSKIYCTFRTKCLEEGLYISNKKKTRSVSSTLIYWYFYSSWLFSTESVRILLSDVLYESITSKTFG